MSLAVVGVISGIASIGTAVLSYQQQQRAASVMEYQADIYREQAQQQTALTQLELGQQELAGAADELAQREEANRARRRAYQLEQNTYAQMAARGTIAKPFGSFGAILGDAEEELYRDLDSNRIQRGFMAVSNLTRLAGTAASGVQAVRQANLERGTALADAGTTRMGSYLSLAQGLTNAYKVMPSGGKN